MNRHEVEQLVATLRLPPNFYASVATEMTPVFGTTTILLTAYWDDIYHPGGKSSTYARIEPHAQMPRELVVKMIYNELRMMWMHELHEWFTVGGVHYRDPHPDGVDGPLG